LEKEQLDFMEHEDDQQSLSHDSGIDEAGRARLVTIPSGNQFWAAYDWAAQIESIQ
jgi:hypothetical protein